MAQTAAHDELAAAVQCLLDGLALSWCPTCTDALTPTTATGQAAECRACTERWLGFNTHQNGLRIEAGQTVKAWRERDPEAPMPLGRRDRWNTRARII